MSKILFQNSDFIAVEKPDGISVHNIEETENLLQVLAKQFQDESGGLVGAKLFPVHRLDKETSGIQILALNENAARKLASEFEHRTVEKVYRGLLRGRLASDETVWNRPLTDKAEGRKNPEGLAKDRVSCETRVRVVNQNQFFTDCEFHLVTGRQHQIRKHSAIAKHALVGDSRYGDPKYNQKMAELYGTERMFLHCSKLAIAGVVIDSPVPEVFHKLFV